MTDARRSNIRRAPRMRLERNRRDRPHPHQLGRVWPHEVARVRLLTEPARVVVRRDDDRHVLVNVGDTAAARRAQRDATTVTGKRGPRLAPLAPRSGYCLSRLVSRARRRARCRGSTRADALAAPHRAPRFAGLPARHPACGPPLHTGRAPCLAPLRAGLRRACGLGCALSRGLGSGLSPRRGLSRRLATGRLLRLCFRRRHYRGRSGDRHCGRHPDQRQGVSSRDHFGDGIVAHVKLRVAPPRPDEHTVGLQQ